MARRTRPTANAAPTPAGGGANRRALPVIEGEPADWGMAALAALARAHSGLERRMAAVLAAHGLTPAQFDVLATLAAGEGITQQELAGLLLVTKGNVVGLVDRVCQAGWVERHADPDDRRANRLHLTDRGRERLGKAGPGVVRLHTAFVGGFSQGELRQLHDLLRRLEAAAE